MSGQSLDNDAFSRSISNGGASKNSASILIEVTEPQSHGVGNKRYTDYLVKTRTTLPIFTNKEFSVRRRYSDFEWLRSRIEQQLKIKTPVLPDKAWKRQIPFMKDTLFDDQFIEDRRKALDDFVNRLSEHPLVQTEKIWVSFLQDDELVK